MAKSYYVGNSSDAVLTTRFINCIRFLIMMDQHFYNTIDRPATTEFKDRGSRFIAYLFPVKKVADIKLHLDEVKKIHPKATHHCFAYRLGHDGNTFRASDAGEPPGTAGRPILGQIDSKHMTDVLIVVVRYFGGTLLGVPGLINAYKTAAALVLQLVPVVKKSVEVNCELQFDYTRLNEVMTIIRQYDCTIHLQDLQLFCRMEIGIPKSLLETVLNKFKDCYGLSVSLT